MKLSKIKCEKCGKEFPFNTELPKLVCIYCGNEIQTKGVETEKATETKQEDKNKIQHYKRMVKVNIVVCVAAFVAWLLFINSENIIISFAVVILLCLLNFRDAYKAVSEKNMLVKNGVQAGNITGLFVFVIVDIALWGLLMISQFKSLVQWNGL